MHLNVFELVSSLQYVGILLLSTVFAPELVMPIVGYLAWTGVISLVGGVAAGVVGATVGAIGLYWFARAFRGRALDKLVTRYSSRLDHFDLNKRPVSNDKLKYSVLISRFIPAVRSAMSIPAGLRKMPLKTFVTYTAIGNVIWISLLALLGYAANVSYQSIQSSATAAALIAGGVLAVGIVGKIIYNHLVRPKLHLHGA